MLHYLELEYPQALFRIVVWEQEEEVSDNMMFVVTYITTVWQDEFQLWTFLFVI